MSLNPPPNRGHLYRLTDDTGIIQHGLYSLPDPHQGYSLDDNARALIVSLKLYQLFGNKEDLDLAYTYLAFVRYAQTTEGRFHNYLAYDRTWLDQTGSEDAYGRALWAMGYTMASKVDDGLAQAARHILHASLLWPTSLTSPRAWAFTLLGLGDALVAYPQERGLMPLLKSLSDRLVRLFEQNSDRQWRWFEDRLTYSNARLSQALLSSFRILPKKEYLSIGCKSLDFLIDTLSHQDHFDLIGCHGWYIKGGPRAFYDQQPIDAGAMAEACWEAFEVTGEKHYYEAALQAFQWFHGKNCQGVPLYVPENGACYDGLQLQGPNINMGAESTLAYLMACLALWGESRRAVFPLKLKEKAPALLAEQR
ncbi:MAG: glycosyltransferase [Chloroflexi bacterium]|nr:glycosyltransferase [Chloroflexota bacterium]